MDNLDKPIARLLDESVNYSPNTPVAWGQMQSVLRALLNTTPPGGVDQFIELIDCPSSYSGAAGMLPIVNAGATGLMFGDALGLSGAITVDAVTTAALPANTYNNAGGGVGATLTANANGAFPTIDGQTAGVGKIYLVKNEATKTKNGVYRLSTLGTAGTAWVLTRATNSDSTAELDNQIVFAAYNGGTNGRRYFIQTTASPTVGTSNIVYVVNKAGGSQSLSQTLAIGNDAGAQDIVNVANLGIGVTSPSVELDVLGDVFVSNATYPTGLLTISETPLTADNLNVIVGTYGDMGLGLNYTDNIITLTITYDALAATNAIHIGDSTGSSSAGLNIDFSGGTSIGAYRLGRIGGGTNIQINDDNSGGGSIFNTFQASGTWIAAVAGGSNIVQIDSTGLLTDNITELTAAAGVTINSGLKVDAINSATGVLTIGGTSLVLNSSLGNLDITIGLGQIITMNGANTYTGTVAGAAALNIVNGLVMA